jgi:hypothetical protein
MADVFPDPIHRSPLNSSGLMTNSGDRYDRCVTGNTRDPIDEEFVS